MLDPLARHQLLQVLDDLHRTGMTVVTITHAMSEAARAQRVIVMAGGAVALDGSPQDVFAADDLPALGLSLPLVFALVQRLRVRLPGFPTDAYTVDALADTVWEWKRDSSHH